MVPTKRPRYDRLLTVFDQEDDKIVNSIASYLQNLDALSFLAAISTSTKRIIEVASLAGCGKTFILNLFARHTKAVDETLVLSFSRAAIEVAEKKIKCASMTFDSFGYRVTKSCVDWRPTGLDYQDYRDMSKGLKVEDVARSGIWDGIRYIFVDEAQDSIPEAKHILELALEMGIVVVVVGDKYQNIFGFQGSECLFNQITVKHTLTLGDTYRCNADIVAFVRQRFNIPDMRSAQTNVPRVNEVCVQARSNWKLAEIYVSMLFSTQVKPIVRVAKDSHAIFQEAVIRLIADTYDLSTTEANEALHARQREVEDLCGNVPSMIFATVHGFKGDQCDVTILADDIRVDDESSDEQEENIKYTAITRARFGVLCLGSMRYIGDEAIRDDIATIFTRHRAQLATAARGQSIPALTSKPHFILPVVCMPVFDVLRRSFPTTIKAQDTVSSAEGVWDVCQALVQWSFQAVARCAVVKSDRFVRARQCIRRDRMLGEVGPGLQYAVRSKVARHMIGCLLARHLVLKGHVGPTSKIAIIGAWRHCAIKTMTNCWKVDRFIDRVQTPVPFLRTRFFMMSTDKIMQAFGEPRHWSSVAIGQHVASGDVKMYGEYDVVVRLRDGSRHAAFIKTTRHIRTDACLNVAMHAVIDSVPLTSLRILDVAGDAVHDIDLGHTDTLRDMLRREPGMRATLRDMSKGKNKPYYRDGDVTATLMAFVNDGQAG